MGKRSAEGRSKPDVQGQAFFTKEELDTHLQNLSAFAWDWGLTREQLLLVVELFTKHQLRTSPSPQRPPSLAKEDTKGAEGLLFFLLSRGPGRQAAARVTHTAGQSG